MAFRFRQFTVEDRQSTLRIGTDSMLFGAWANPGKADKILDIGTGCGVLALMMAQKSEAIIKAIDIDQPSVLEANANFSSSPWPSRLEAIHAPLQEFRCGEVAEFDFIITNPPYYSNSLKSPSLRINHTRHDERLSLGELAANADRLLKADGRLAIILPPAPFAEFQRICVAFGLYPMRSLVVFPRENSPAKRVLAEYARSGTSQPETAELTILDASGKYTAEYLALTMPFHDF